MMDFNEVPRGVQVVICPHENITWNGHECGDCMDEVELPKSTPVKDVNFKGDVEMSYVVQYTYGSSNGVDFWRDYSDSGRNCSFPFTSVPLESRAHAAAQTMVDFLDLEDEEDSGDGGWRIHYRVVLRTEITEVVNGA